MPRFVSGVEARLNTTTPALKPHAGGVLRAWSAATENEIRDDQGIGISNPDTGLLQPYNLAGAYDSNVALSHYNTEFHVGKVLRNLLKFYVVWKSEDMICI